MKNKPESVDQDIRAIDAWLERTGMTASRLGLLACANARAVERVRNGTATIKTLRGLLRYIEKN